MFAYVGPGAGLALAGSFLTLLFALLTACGLLLSWPVRSLLRWFHAREARRRAAVRRVIVLGLDGLDPQLTETLLEAGLLPNLARLKSQGTYQQLATTWPPLSPVAWSTFSTGVNPGKHAIFDFVRPSRANYQPEIATVRLQNQHPVRKRKWNPFRQSTSQSSIHALRRSQSFWKVLGGHGIYCAVLRVPVTFPPERFYGVQLSAASVPDLRGTNGSYTHFHEAQTLEREESKSTQSRQALSNRRRTQRHGRWVQVHRHKESIETQLPGPPHPLRADRAEVQKPLKLTKDTAGLITLQVDEQRIPLTVGHISPWVRLTFRLSWNRKITGVCRFHLNRWEEPFSLYCTPIQIDPTHPAMPISSPPVFSRYLAAKQGDYATLGLAEDTNALTDGVLSEDAFLNQVASIQQEREQMFFDMLRRVKRGMIACVFDGPDRMQHIFWNHAKESDAAILSNEKLKKHYQQMDDLVGRTLNECDDQTGLLVISDHGFQAFRRAVDINAWLHEQGYLHWNQSSNTEQPATVQPMTIADIDWSRTKAFACGLSGLYLNQQGRQSAGIVPPGEASERLVQELCDKLTGLKDNDMGEVAILEAVSRDTVFSGPYLKQAPDIVIGYNAGYRVHWETATGGSVKQVFTDNNRPWCGDHCQHPAVVPGVLFSNRRLQASPGLSKLAVPTEQHVAASETAQMIDIAPTVLDLLGVIPPAYIDGKTLRCDDATSFE